MTKSTSAFLRFRSQMAKTKRRKTVHGFFYITGETHHPCWLSTGREPWDLLKFIFFMWLGKPSNHHTRVRHSQTQTCLQIKTIEKPYRRNEMGRRKSRIQYNPLKLMFPLNVFIHNNFYIITRKKIII